jgi:N-acetylmuramic acid 6-phosphate etherase
MDRYVLGVAGGASKTAAVVMDERRQVLGRGNSGPANYHRVGLDGARIALLAAMQGAADRAGIDPTDVAAVTWALAGAGRQAGAQLLEDLNAELLPGTLGRVETDGVAALVGGTGTRHGVVLVAGTGMIAYGENAAGDRARAGGWGHLLDRGSAYGLAQEALRAVALASDSSDLPTGLSERILGFLSLKNPTDLVNWLYAPDRQLTEVTDLAPIVLAEAEAGDLVAVDVVVRGAEALARAVDTVARRLDLWDQQFPLVLAGGLLTTTAFYRQVVVQAVRTRMPGAQPMLPHADAAVGAALLALEALGHSLEPQIDIEARPTDAWASEQRNFLTRDLDLRSTLEAVGLMHLEDRRAMAAVRPNLPAIAKAVDAIANRMRQGGRLIYVGAGTSGRLGVLDASECPPTFGTDPGQVMGIIAGGKRALSSAAEAAEDDPGAGQKAIADVGVGPWDTVVGIAASGRTPYVLGALEEARRRGGLTLALVCNLPAPLAQGVDHVIAPLVGPEVIAGSTRLKAGTAQKLVLNMLSTGVMVRLGKTHGNLMVDVRQKSAKLQNRARRIVAQACDLSEEEAGAALASSQGHVKVAIVSTLLECTPEEARERLALVDGQVRAAVAGEDRLSLDS